MSLLRADFTGPPSSLNLGEVVDGGIFFASWNQTAESRAFALRVRLSLSYSLSSLSFSLQLGHKKDEARFEEGLELRRTAPPEGEIRCPLLYVPQGALSGADLRQRSGLSQRLRLDAHERLCLLGGIRHLPLRRRR